MTSLKFYKLNASFKKKLIKYISIYPTVTDLIDIKNEYNPHSGERSKNKYIIYVTKIKTINLISNTYHLPC